MKSKAIGFLIFLFVLLVPFRFSVLRDNLESSVSSALWFVLVVAGAVAGAYLLLNQPLDKNKEA